MVDIVNSDGSVSESAPKVIDQTGSVTEVPVRVITPDGSVQTVYKPLEIVDDFEDHNLYAYDRVAAPWKTTTSAAIEGAYGLQGSNADSGYIFALDDGSGGMPGDTWLPRGSRFSFKWKLPSDDSGRFFMVFGKGSIDKTYDHYEAWMFENTSETRLVKDAGNGNTTLAQTSTSYSLGTVYRTEIGYDVNGDGTLTLDVFDTSTDPETNVASLSATDTAFSNNGFGFYSYSSSEVYVDGIKRLD